MIPVKYLRNNMIFFHFHILPLYELPIKNQNPVAKLNIIFEWSKKMP